MDVQQRSLGVDKATENNSLVVIVVTAIMTLFATVAITLRIYGCLFILRRRLYFEEWLSVINQVGSLQIGKMVSYHSEFRASTIMCVGVNMC